MDNPIIVNSIIIGVLLIIVGGIVWFLIRQKKKGAACIGCPYAGKCTGGSGCSCSGKGSPKPDISEHQQNESK